MRTNQFLIGITLFTGISIAGFVGALVVGAAVSSGDEHLPEVSIRGEIVDPANFSLTELHTAQQKRQFDDAHAANMVSCMTSRGFTEEPRSLDSILRGRTVEEAREEYPDLDPAEVVAYAAAYGEAAIGTEVQTRRVDLDGERGNSEMQISGSWTEETCFWQSYASMGTDPFTFTGLRMTMNALADEADALMLKDDRLGPALDEWSACSGTSAAAMVGALTSTSLTADDRAAPCLAAIDASVVVAVRGEYHLAAAAENQAIVNEWVATLDRALGG